MAGHTRTFILMAAMTALLMGLGWLLGGQGGAIVALVAAGAGNLWAWWNSDKAVLRQQGAVELTCAQGGELVALVAELARNAGLPTPRVYLLPTEQPNAFATGRNPQNAAVAVTQGLLRILTRDELAGVNQLLALGFATRTRALELRRNEAEALGNLGQFMRATDEAGQRGGEVRPVGRRR